MKITITKGKEIPRIIAKIADALGGKSSSPDIDLRLRAKSIAELGLGIVQRFTPKGRTKTVRDSMKAKELTPLHYVIYSLLSQSDKGQLILNVLESGSVAHQIIPTNKKVLKWTETGFRTYARLASEGLKIQGTTKAQGNVVFAKYVNHPGTKPYRMFEQGRYFLDKHLKQAGGKIGESIARFWAGGRA